MERVDTKATGHCQTEQIEQILFWENFKLFLQNKFCQKYTFRGKNYWEVYANKVSQAQDELVVVTA